MFTNGSKNHRDHRKPNPLPHCVHTRHRIVSKPTPDSKSQRDCSQVGDVPPATTCECGMSLTSKQRLGTSNVYGGRNLLEGSKTELLVTQLHDVPDRWHIQLPVSEIAGLDIV